jgi:hypothetical protein
MLDEGQDFAYELAFDLLLKVSSYIFGFFDVEPCAMSSLRNERVSVGID